MKAETLEIRVIAEIVKNMLPIQNLLTQTTRARQSPDWSGFTMILLLQFVVEFSNLHGLCDRVRKTRLFITCIHIHFVYSPLCITSSSNLPIVRLMESLWIVKITLRI